MSTAMCGRGSRKISTHDVCRHEFASVLTIMPKNAKDEIDELLNGVLPFAQQMLSEYGEFLPYGGALTSEGELIDIGASNEEEYPSSQELIDLMTESFQAMAESGEYRATAIVCDVRVVVPSTRNSSDAIRVLLDHVKGESVEVLLPYEAKEGGEISYGEMFAQKGEARIFKTEKRGH